MQTNTELVTEIMESHPMCQIVVIEALRHYTAKVISGGLPALEQAFGPHPLVHPAAWFSACEKVHQRITHRSVE